MSSPSDWKSLHTLLWTLARRSSESAALITAAESIAAAQARQPLRLVSTGGSGGLALYCAPNSAERLDDLEPESSVIRLRLHRRHRKPIGVESEGWSTLLEHNAREVVLHEWPAAKSWAVEFPPALSRDTRATATQICRGFLGGCAKTLRPMDSSFAWEDVFDRYKRLVSDARGGYVQIPVMFLPFACGYSARRHSKESVVPWFLGVSISAAAWLRFAAPTREQAEEARAWTIGRYRNTQHAEVEHGDLELLRSFRVARHWPSSARPESMVMGGAMWRITALESALSAADVHTSMLAGFARAGEGERLVWMPPELADPATALPALEAALAPLLAHLRASAALLPPPPLGRRDRAEFARGVRRRAIVFLPMTLPASDSTPTASPAHAPADWERFNELRGALRRRHAEIEEAAHLVLQDLRALEFAKSLAPGRFVRLRSVVGPGPAAGGTARVLSVRPDAEVGVLVEVRAWDAAADAPIMLVRPAQLVLA